MTVAEKARSLVGQGYLYGAKGQRCTEALRQKQAAQYPDQAATILGAGARWDGHPVWDCAQLTRACAAEAGVALPSGATSQWRNGPWARKGEIATLPPGETAFLYREGDGRMQHTGVALGDGTCVHARGTAWGVVRQAVRAYGWTHWASPWRAGNQQNMKEETMEKEVILKVTGGKLALREAPNTAATLLFRMPDGTRVALLEDGGAWKKVRYTLNGVPYMGWCMAEYLAADEAGSVRLTLERAEARALHEALEKALEGGEA